ncbi:MAG: DUF5906 domain-containing protein [Xenococcaceae cyanobacterium MO_207.B15]|nr:DUF5906 domain-containing protein [Xenococcaceae cyanobacterium MO_207.B15]
MTTVVIQPQEKTSSLSPSDYKHCCDLQKFLHLIGGGGSGKSTFTNLLTALIGEENTVTIDLSDLEDKHERARIFGKRLVVLPDQDKAPKKLSSFKRLTGCTVVK